ncbi:pantoate--beta-alanine ligase [Paenibacillus sp. HB172176]|uniref:pantoate--beta-alanine ligase n=1 Tax=Paenibacillus sp. HB172176 TaxID=2493690 RepID=UPI0014390C87|nr:pantoate--beta-alanine ligase [Paenibacillus sp. HB172176]
MKVCRTKQELKRELKERRKGGYSLGLVPTMGFLHEGHASLLRRARAENDIVVLSIFVNPLQFGPNEDFDRYPRNEAKDLAIAAEQGADLVFAPTVEEMYPSKPLTNLKVEHITERLCGASRPGHFDGVGVVVSKLFHLTAPDKAYFGMKDAQQAAVIEQMVLDLDFDLEVVKCDIVREPDGLALSSRNVYLTAEQRQQAVVLSRTLAAAEGWLQDADLTIEDVMAKVRDAIEEAEQAVIDYAELLHYPSLEEIDPGMRTAATEGQLIMALAVKFGATRLIDNQLYAWERG